MTLRLRYYLAIVPLFLGLALVNSVLVYYTERNEIYWGLQERAQGAAASIVGFWDVIEPGAPGESASALKRYGQRLGGLSIAWFELDGETWRERALLATTDVAAPPLPDASASAALRRGDMAWAFVEAASANADLSVGYAPMLDATGKLSAVIGVAERDTSLREELARLRTRLAGLTLALLLAGVMVAELITRIARRELQALTSAAQEAAHGRYLSHWPAGRIRELNDLGGTLLTMTSLLADESHQTRRRFFQAEPLPGDANLAAGYRTHQEQALPDVVGPITCAYRRLGPLSPDDFCGWRETPTGWYLCVGRSVPAAHAQGMLDRMVHAEATREFLLGVAVSRPSGPSWPEALKMFPCEALQVIFFSNSGRAVTGWSLDPTRKVPVALIPANGREVLGTLPASALQVGQAYVNQFQDRSLQQIADELSGLLGARYHGLLMICDSTATTSTGTP